MKLLLNVRCLNDMACDVPSTFYTELSHEQIEKIKALSKVVIDTDAYCIEKFFHSGTWHREICDGTQLEGVQENETPEVLENTVCRVDIPIIRITNNRVTFTSVPKHASDDMALITNSVPLEALKLNTNFVSVD